MILTDKREVLIENFLKGNFFQSTVVDDADPLKANRLKVQIDGVTDEIDKEDLPWYYIKMAPKSGANAKNDTPNIDSRVIVYFPEEDIMNGIIVESISSIPPAMT